MSHWAKFLCGKQSQIFVYVMQVHLNPYSQNVVIIVQVFLNVIPLTSKMYFYTSLSMQNSPKPLLYRVFKHLLEYWNI